MGERVTTARANEIADRFEDDMLDRGMYESDGDDVRTLAADRDRLSAIVDAVVAHISKRREELSEPMGAVIGLDNFIARDADQRARCAELKRVADVIDTAAEAAAKGES